MNRTLSNFFTATDAEYDVCSSMPSISIARANQLLADYVRENGVKLELIEIEPGRYRQIWIPGVGTHTGILLDVKKIEEKEPAYDRFEPDGCP